jgi:hypothetical protein
MHFPCFAGLPVYYKRNQAGPASSVVHERVSLGGGHEGEHGLALALDFRRKCGEIISHLFAFSLDTGVGCGGHHTSLSFPLQ